MDYIPTSQLMADYARWWKQNNPAEERSMAKLKKSADFIAAFWDNYLKEKSKGLQLFQYCGPQSAANPVPPKKKRKRIMRDTRGNIIKIIENRPVVIRNIPDIVLPRLVPVGGPLLPKRQQLSRAQQRPQFEAIETRRREPNIYYPDIVQIKKPSRPTPKVATIFTPNSWEEIAANEERRQQLQTIRNIRKIIPLTRAEIREIRETDYDRRQRRLAEQAQEPQAAPTLDDLAELELYPEIDLTPINPRNPNDNNPEGNGRYRRQ